MKRAFSTGHHVQYKIRRCGMNDYDTTIYNRQNDKDVNNYKSKVCL